MKICHGKLTNFYKETRLRSEGGSADPAHCHNIWWSVLNSQSDPEQFRVFSGLETNEEYQKQRPTKLRFRVKIAKIRRLRFEFEYEIELGFFN